MRMAMKLRMSMRMTRTMMVVVVVVVVAAVVAVAPRFPSDLHQAWNMTSGESPGPSTAADLDKPTLSF